MEVGQQMTIDKRLDILFKLLILAVMLSPFNYNIYSIRPLDIVLIIFIILAIPMINIQSNNLKSVLLFFTIFTVSIAMGAIFSSNDTNLLRGLFIYKYLLPFLLIAVVYSIPFNSKQLDLLVKVLFFAYLFLVIWVFIAVLDHILFAPKHISSFRPAFPFRDNPFHSDAHLYSIYLSVGLIFFIGMYNKLNISGYYKIPFILLSLAALLMTGSKTGILILVISLIMSLFIMKKKYIFYTIATVSIGLLFIYSLSHMSSLNIEFINHFIFLSNRAFSYESLSAYLESNRIEKMYMGIADASIFNYFIGVGIFKSILTWYDSLIGSLMSHVGLVGILAFLYVLFRLVLNNQKYVDSHTKVYYYLFIILLICYFIANNITEFYLVSRSVFPFVMYLSILYHYMRLEYLKKDKESLS